MGPGYWMLSAEERLPVVASWPVASGMSTVHGSGSSDRFSLFAYDSRLSGSLDGRDRLPWQHMAPVTIQTNAIIQLCMVGFQGGTEHRRSNRSSSSMGHKAIAQSAECRVQMADHKLASMSRGEHIRRSWHFEPHNANLSMSHRLPKWTNHKKLEILP